MHVASFCPRLILSFLVATTAVRGQTTRIDSCDATWLWPAPSNTAEVDRLISMDGILDSDGKPAWSDEIFADFLKIANSDASAVQGSAASDRRVEFPDEFRDRKTWKIAGLRIDPTAPGGHSAIRGQFGETPQIRLIVQPVTMEGGKPKVHDVAAHLVFSYVSGVDGTKKIPNRDKFQEIVEDILALKKKCAENGVDTTGKALGIHPGLTGSVPGLTAAVTGVLKKHLIAQRMMAMAIMGLDRSNPEPWIFVAMFRMSPTESFRAFPIPVYTEPHATNPADQVKTAQMLSFVDSTNVLPVPQTDNLNPMTAKFSVPKADRRGVSTAPLFAGSDMDAAAIVGLDSSGQAVADARMKNSDIPDHIANPQTSHFFNTDCISCHTESQRRILGGLDAGSFAFKWPDGVAKLDDAVSQNKPWNVRNLGWFPHVRGGGNVHPTISQRTANETAEVVEFINEEYLSN